MQTVRDRFVKARKEANLTQQEVAERLHVSRSTILRYEAGSTFQIRQRTIVQMADAVNADSWWLLSGAESPALPISDTKKD